MFLGLCGPDFVRSGRHVGQMTCPRATSGPLSAACLERTCSCNASCSSSWPKAPPWTRDFLGELFQYAASQWRSPIGVADSQVTTVVGDGVGAPATGSQALCDTLLYLYHFHHFEGASPRLEFGRHLLAILHSFLRPLSHTI